MSNNGHNGQNHKQLALGKLVFLEGCSQNNLKFQETILYDFLFIYQMKYLTASVQ